MYKLKPCPDCGKQIERVKTRCFACFNIYRTGRERMPRRERFLSKVNKSDSCWLWKAGIDDWGYGVFKVMGKDLKAHRVSYELFIGPIPLGLIVCHHCDNPPCVRPDHLFVGTHKDNCHDMIAKGRDNRVRGEQVKLSKLRESDVVEIRSLYPGLNSYQLANSYGVNRTTINSVVRLKTWKHVAGGLR